MRTFSKILLALGFLFTVPAHAQVHNCAAAPTNGNAAAWGANGCLADAGVPVVPTIASGNVLGNNTSGSAPAAASTLTSIIDQAIGSTRGSILERGASGWQLLTPGSANLTLVSNGGGADPTYQAPFASISSGNVIGNNTAGSANAAASTLTSLIDRAIGSTRGSILERGASGWTLLTPGTVGTVIASNGSGADPSYQAFSTALTAPFVLPNLATMTLNCDAGATVTEVGSVGTTPHYWVFTATGGLQCPIFTTAPVTWIAGHTVHIKMAADGQQWYGNSFPIEGARTALNSPTDLTNLQRVYYSVNANGNGTRLLVDTLSGNGFTGVTECPIVWVQMDMEPATPSVQSDISCNGLSFPKTAVTESLTSGYGTGTAFYPGIDLASSSFNPPGQIVIFIYDFEVSQ